MNEIELGYSVSESDVGFKNGLVVLSLVISTYFISIRIRNLIRCKRFVGNNDYDYQQTKLPL